MTKYINIGVSGTYEVYKVVKDEENGYVSSAAHGVSMLVYRENKWTYPKKEYLQLGYGIFALRSSEYIWNYLQNYIGWYNSKIFLAITSEILANPKPIDGLERTANNCYVLSMLKDSVPTGITWPQGTVICKDLMLIKDITSEIY